MPKDAYYFPHDSNARNDEKCMYIIGKYGLQGYGLYWVLVESMHEQEDGKLTCALLDGFANRYNIDITVLKQIYNDAITISLFVTDDIKYWSERVLKNKDELAQKRELKSIAGKLGMAKRWQIDNTVITKHNKGKESTVKEKKINKLKEIVLPEWCKKLQEFKEFEIDETWINDVEASFCNVDLMEATKDFIDYWGERKKKEIKSMKATYKNSLRNCIKWGKCLKNDKAEEKPYTGR